MENINIKPLEWFQARTGKKVYRTSFYFPGIVYRLQMLKHHRRKVEHNIKIVKPYGLCTYITIKEDNFAECEEDAVKQFNSQKVPGFRFSDHKPEGFALSQIAI